MPEDPWRRAFTSQRHAAKRRGIPFLFTFDEWCAWWRLDGRWSNRGIGRGKFVMARRGDVGPYSPENVYCATQEQNRADAPQLDPAILSVLVKADWQRKRAAGIECHLKGKMGDAHPRSRAVVTPMGRFGSANLAAQAYGFTRQYVGKRCRAGTDGWRFE